MTCKDKMVLILFSSLPFLIGLVVMLVIWCETRCPNEPKLKFSSFKKFYVLNPNRWNLYDTGVSCRNDEGGTIATYFGFIDFYRYLLWQKRFDKKKEDEVQAESLARIIAVVKKDIEKTESSAQRQYDEATKIIRKVCDSNDSI